MDVFCLFIYVYATAIELVFQQWMKQPWVSPVYNFLFLLMVPPVLETLSIVTNFILAITVQHLININFKKYTSETAFLERSKQTVHETTVCFSQLLWGYIGSV